MPKAFKSETRPRADWAVTIHAAPEGSGFYTTCVSPTGSVLSTDVCVEKGSAWQQGYKLVDEAVRKEKTERYNAIALPLTLALLYVSGEDKYYEHQEQRRFKHRRAWKGHDFDILNLLEDRGLIEEQSNRHQTKSVYLTPEGIKEARLAMRNLNLQIEIFLAASVEHEGLPDRPNAGSDGE